MPQPLTLEQKMRALLQMKNINSADFIKERDNLVAEVADTLKDHKDDLLQISMGTGEADYLGSTKLGSFGIVMCGVKGEILGSLETSRMNEIKDDIEDLAALNNQQMNVDADALQNIRVALQSNENIKDWTNDNSSMNEFYQLSKESPRPSPYD